MFLPIDGISGITLPLGLFFTFNLFGNTNVVFYQWRIYLLKGESTLWCTQFEGNLELHV
jgi:hypothetical protein